MAASSGRLRCLRLVSRWLLPLAVVLPSHAATVVAQLGDLTLEQLRDVRVVTVSRFEEQLDATAASVYVITADEIRRSGASTIGEALRLAPLLDVATDLMPPPSAAGMTAPTTGAPTAGA